MSTLPFTESNAEERDYVESRIISFNRSKVPFTQEEDFIHLSYVTRNSGEIIAGINALLYCWKCLYIDILWVDEAYRAHGYGSALLQHVEQVAKSYGSHLTHLDTFDFQAKDFYLKQ